MPKVIFDVNCDASGDGTGYSVPFKGDIQEVEYDYNASAAAGTDLTLTLDNTAGTQVLTLTNNNSDGSKKPRAQVHDAADGSDAGVYDWIYNDGYRVKGVVDEAGSSALSPCVTVTITYRETHLGTN